MEQTERFPYPGAIDADGHILEPPDTWERYIDPEFRDRAIRIRKDRDGLEVLEIGGRLSKYRRPGQLADSGAMGRDPKQLGPSPDRTYVNQAPFGSMDPKERLALLDQDGLDKAIIYPTLGLSWETEDVEDLELQAAYARAYNRWVVDFCADSGGRLIPIAHISFGDGNEAARELARGQSRLQGRLLRSLHANEQVPWPPGLRSVLGEGSGTERARRHPSERRTAGQACPSTLSRYAEVGTVAL